MEHARDCFASSWQLLKRNQELRKVLLAYGLQRATASLPDIFVLSVLRTKYWGYNMAAYASIMAIGINFVAILLGGPFGKISDRLDRRLAAGVVAVASFAPGWVLLVFGFTARGLWISTGVKVISAFGNTSNVMFALVGDATAVEDQDEAFGLAYASAHLIGLLLNGLPVLLVFTLKALPSSPVFFLALQWLMSILCLSVLSSVRLGHKGQEKEMIQEADSQILTTGEAVNRGQEVEFDAGQSNSRSCNPLCMLMQQLLSPILLAARNPRLRRIIIATFLVGLSGSMTFDIGGQFFNQSLDLIQHGTDLDIGMVSVLEQIPGQLLSIPLSVITGHLAKSCGPLSLIRWMIPMCCMLMSVGALMALVRHMWFIAVVTLCLNCAGMIHVPLMRLASGLAPPGRVGESLSAVGVATEVASLLANGLVVSCNSVLINAGLFDPLWIYYPIGGLISLCALAPLSGTPPGGWGTGSAIVYAHRAQAKWRRRIEYGVTLV